MSIEEIELRIRRDEERRVGKLPSAPESGKGWCRIALDADKLYILLPGGRIHDEFDYNLKQFHQVVSNLKPEDSVVLGNFRVYHCGDGGYHPGQIGLQSIRNTWRNKKGTIVYFDPEVLVSVATRAQKRFC